MLKKKQIMYKYYLHLQLPNYFNTGILIGKEIIYEL